jgi:hypothetical protein
MGIYGHAYFSFMPTVEQVGDVFVVIAVDACDMPRLSTEG